MEFLNRGILAADWADFVTAVAYAIAAVVSWQAAHHAAGRGETRERLFWLGCALALIVLGINELFDFQTLGTMIAKDHAKAAGWYGSRRTIQLVFVSVLTAASLCTLAVLAWFVRAMGRPVKMALAGLALIGLFIALRAAIFHHVDELFAIGPILTGAGAVAEIAGIVIVAFAARVYLTSGRREGTRDVPTR